MFVRVALAALVLSLAACDRPASQDAGTQDAPQLEAPAPDSEPSRVFAPQNPAARTATGQLTVIMATRLPDANTPNADPQDTLSLTGATGLVVAADISGNVSPATQVGGQTLRALLNLPVEEPQTLVYRVTSETKPSTGQGLCGADAPAFVVVWEPSGPGEPVMKIMGVIGAAPGAAGARACPMLEYRRQ
jgi:hypothetical protein